MCSVQNLPVVPGEHLPGVSDAAGLLLPRGDQVHHMMKKFLRFVSTSLSYHSFRCSFTVKVSQIFLEPVSFVLKQIKSDNLAERQLCLTLQRANTKLRHTSFSSATAQLSYAVPHYFLQFIKNFNKKNAMYGTACNAINSHLKVIWT